MARMESNYGNLKPEVVFRDASGNTHSVPPGTNGTVYVGSDAAGNIADWMRWR